VGFSDALAKTYKSSAHTIVPFQMKKHDYVLCRILGFAYDNSEDMHMLVFEVESALDKSSPDADIVKITLGYIELIIKEGWADFYDSEYNGTNPMDSSTVIKVVQKRWEDINFDLPDMGEIICFTLTDAGKAKYKELSDQLDG
jgi:hypothetical protein